MNSYRRILLLMLMLLAIGGWGRRVEALECGHFVRDDCAKICAGKTVIGCKTCGVWCEECECGPPVVDTEMVCCHMKGPTCESAMEITGAFEWMMSTDCDRFWGGAGEKTCPNEMCGK